MRIGAALSSAVYRAIRATLMHSFLRALAPRPIERALFFELPFFFRMLTHAIGEAADRMPQLVGLAAIAAAGHGQRALERGFERFDRRRARHEQ